MVRRGAPDREHIAARLAELRERTLALIGTLSESELRRQPCDALGPLLWDVGHMAHFEELWCIRALGAPRVAAPHGFTHAQLDHLYDASQQPREHRERLALPNREQSLAYLERVRVDTLAALSKWRAAPEKLSANGFIWRLMAGHEAQHQETLLQSLEALGLSWSLPGLRTQAPLGTPVPDLARASVPGGRYPIGSTTHAPYDNERPAFAIQLEAFEIDRYPVSNRRYADFINEGGYARKELWSAEGWAWRESEQIELPLYWDRVGSALRVRRRGGYQELKLSEPVQHVSHHEAEAFARWSGARLPTEFEWETAASFDPATGERCADRRHRQVRLQSGPSELGQSGTAPSAFGLHDLHGSVYQWTSSPFQGYEGFRAFPYAQYSRVFFGRRYRVLRGSSWAAACELRRDAYRNWDLPRRRQMFCGLRLAWS